LKKSHLDVLVIGSPCLDIIFGGMPHWPVLGQEMYVANFAISVGAVFNTAATLTRLGMRVGILCELGNDFASRFILEEIEKAGICSDFILMRDYPLRTVTVSLAYEGERGFVSYADAHPNLSTQKIERISPYDSPQAAWDVEELMLSLKQALAVDDFDAVFMYAYSAMQPLLQVLIEHRELPIFLDVGWYPNDLGESSMSAILKYGTFLMPNLAEAAVITGEQAPEEAVRLLSKMVPTAIVKMGARGVVACQRGQLTYCSALPVKDVIDSTGAGDAFNGGFIYGILKGYSLDDALRCGTICGGLSTTALSGTAAIPKAEELEQLRVHL
jgi:sugar/nucleoside kinase (ribokinase family)